MSSNGQKVTELYRTKDYELASLLYAMGQRLAGHDWQNSVCYFQFEDIAACERVIVDYYNGKVFLNAKAIFDALRTVKGMLRTG